VWLLVSLEGPQLCGVNLCHRLAAESKTSKNTVCNNCNTFNEWNISTKALEVCKKSTDCNEASKIIFVINLEETVILDQRLDKEYLSFSNSGTSKSFSFQFSPVNIIPLEFHTHISSGEWTTGPIGDLSSVTLGGMICIYYTYFLHVTGESKCWLIDMATFLQTIQVL
jgi:hypothetical protein